MLNPKHEADQAEGDRVAARGGCSCEWNSLPDIEEIDPDCPRHGYLLAAEPQP